MMDSITSFLLTLIMDDEIQWLSQDHGMAPSGTAPGSVIRQGQKVPVQRPRVRDGANPGLGEWHSTLGERFTLLRQKLGG
jgi:hypothetical protein